MTHWKARILCLQTLLILMLGCSHRDSPIDEYQFAWQGMSSNLYGSEQAFEIDIRHALSYTRWRLLANDASFVTIAFLEPSSDIALILSMRRPSGLRQWSTSTADGSLEAWLHRSFVPDRQFVEFDELEEFWRHRSIAADQSAIRLEGTASVKMAADLPRSITVDLRSLAPIPLYKVYFESLGSWPPKPAEWLGERLGKPDQMHAIIRGEFFGYWIDPSWRLPI